MKAELNVQETTPLSQEDVAKLSSENIDENGKILGKFNSQEELIKSYKELEKLNYYLGIKCSIILCYM